MISRDRLLVVWRHADAGEPLADAGADFERELTRQGRRQASATAHWLRGVLARPFVVVSSPAPRARQTAMALAAPRIEPMLAPGVALSRLLRATPESACNTVVVVGHQPQLGALILAHLMPESMPERPELALRKSAAWCLQWRAQRYPSVIVAAVHDPRGVSNRAD